MSSFIRAQKDFCIGAIYLVTGGAGLWIGSGYPFGSSARMGAGYFPMVISGLLFGMGVVATAKASLRNGEAVGLIAWKALLLILASIVAFGMFLDDVGFIPSGTILLLMCAAASEKFRLQWKPIIGAVTLVVGCHLVFAKGLGIPMLAFGTWFGPIMPAWLGN